MKIKRVLATVGSVALLMTPVLQASPANAGTVTGGIALVCQAHLPSFPSAGSSGSCDRTGLLPVTPPVNGAGVGAGVDDQGAPWAAAGAGVVSASFGYDETCVSGEPPAIGSATGTLNGTVTAAIDNGQLLTSGTAWSANFQWTRVGLTALVFLGSTKFTFSNGHTATTALALPVPDPVGASGGSSGVALAAFAPVTVPLPTCAAPGALNADVAGAGVNIA